MKSSAAARNTEFVPKGGDIVLTKNSPPADYATAIRQCAEGMRYIGIPNDAVGMLNDLAIHIAQRAVNVGYVTPDQWHEKHVEFVRKLKDEAGTTSDYGVGTLAGFLDYVASLIAATPVRPISSTLN